MALDSFRKKLKDTKRVIRSCKLKKERHTKCIYNDQKKKKWIKIMIYKNYTRHKRLSNTNPTKPGVNSVYSRRVASSYSIYALEREKLIEI
jgi:hypothetical protein